MYYNNYFHIWSFYLNNALVDNIDIFMDDLLHANDSEGDLNKNNKMLSFGLSNGLCFVALQNIRQFYM